MNHTPAMLYVTEYTAPDGTKRRPLVERVPELDTVHIAVSGGVLMMPRDMQEVIAASMFRCAVEDWLTSKECWTLTILSENPDPPVGTREFCIEWADIAIEEDCRDFRGPTIHHALIAAAHAVADAQGIKA